MDKIKYRLVFNRKKQLNGEGKALVQIELYKCKRKIYVSTHIYITEDQWDKKRRAIINHPNARELNLRLWSEISAIEKIELEFWKRGVTPTMMLMKQQLTGNYYGETFEKFARHAIEESDRSESTKSNMQHTVNCIQEFRRGASWDDLNVTFITELERWLRAKGVHVNTIAKHMQHLRAIINEAIRHGHIPQDRDPFRMYSIKKEKTEHRYLTPPELRLMEQHHCTGKAERIRLAFLFCCYTGLRFSDFRALQSDNLKEIDGTTWLMIRTQKTSYNVKIPLSVIFDGKAMKLIKQAGSIEQLADIPCNSDTNRYVKALALEAGIQKRVTFHTARHTCATCLVHQGVPITTVQKILGHTKISTTQLYSEIIPSTILQDLKRCDNSKLEK